MYLKNSRKKQKTVYLTIGSTDSKFSTGKSSRTLVVYDIDVEEFYALVAKFLADQSK